MSSFRTIHTSRAVRANRPIALIGAASRQEGFILLLAVLTLLAIGGVVLLNGLGSRLAGSERQMVRAQASTDVLMLAKDVLLGYAARNTAGGNGYRLGALPTPDVYSSGAINYDGVSDAHCLDATGTKLAAEFGAENTRCLGKLPWQSLGFDLGSVEAHDPVGRVPWLATSANLDDFDQCLKALNSETLTATYTAFNCLPASQTPAPSGTLPYPWLKVFDQDGRLLSDRVAAVLILPGEPITTDAGRVQARATVPLPRPGDYLDSIKLPLGCVAGCTTFDNAGLNNEFIQIAPGTHYPTHAQDANKAGLPVAFNDVLIYITIDELMPLIEKRVLTEMKLVLDAYQTTVGTAGKLPWAAPLISPVDFSGALGQPNTTFGRFPFLVDVVINVAKNEIETPGLGYPPYASDFSWSMASPTVKRSCVASNASASRYINVNQWIPTPYTGTATGPTATCTWKGRNTVDCAYTQTANVSLPAFSFTRYNNKTDCQNNQSPRDTRSYAVTRNTITFTISATCTNPTVTYAADTAISAGRWSWFCPNVPGIDTFSTVSQFTISSPQSITATATINGVGAAATVTGMRYQPLMPYWFYQNEWYKTAFLALGQAKAPANGGPCAKLTVGSNDKDALLILAGAKLSPLQTRP
ncbi:MAG: hypothetical protein JNM52_09075, partial [Betaproteobacteria bacterium]|nr:hypothetical protein [Betaproteobacteria bacterium]